MTDLFIDTSYLVAALNPLDRNYKTAIALQGVLESTSPVTTNHVLGECWTFARRRFGHDAAVKLTDALRRGERYRIVHVDRELEEAALEWLRPHDEREYSFVDAVSFQLMREHNILDALAFDDDFHAAGFRTLVP
jgi:predicted nucleic acid-binding protein